MVVWLIPAAVTWRPHARVRRLGIPKQERWWIGATIQEVAENGPSQNARRVRLSIF